MFKVKKFNYCDGIYRNLPPNHATRGALYNMYIPLSTSSVVSKGVICNPPKLWNELPLRLKALTTLNSFKIHLKKYLLLKQAEN